MAERILIGHGESKNILMWPFRRKPSVVEVTIKGPIHIHVHGIQLPQDSERVQGPSWGRAEDGTPSESESGQKSIEDQLRIELSGDIELPGEFGEEVT